MNMKLRPILFCLLILAVIVPTPSQAQSRQYALWNGFLDMTNILELVNVANEGLSGTLVMYSLSGAQVSEMAISLSAYEQRDVILNGVTGFVQDSYGIVEFVSTGGELIGRLSFYRNAPGSDEYEFAFSVPFTDVLSGESSVAFNTFQPSINPSDSANLVAQWLSIVNLHADAQKGFWIFLYDSVGELLFQERYEVGSFQRVDIAAGHSNPGPNNVGQVRIVPEDTSASYMAQLIRYGEAQSSNGPRYAFAFPLLASAGNGSEMWVSISNGAGASNWLEIVNAGDGRVAVTLECYDNAGTRVWEGELVLEGYEQQHFYATGVMGDGVSGAARILPADPSARVYAQSMFYFRDADGSIEATYGLQAGGAGTGDQYASYNLYLGMYNWLRIFNTQAASQTVNYEISGSHRGEQTLELCARCGIDLGLHDTSTYDTTLNSYGIVHIEGEISGELLRLRPSSSGGIDYASPTRVVAGPEWEGGGLAGLIYPEDFVYQGAFRLPEGTNGSDWRYSGEALTYYPDGDPSGPADGYPGSLFGTSHNQQQYVSEISIPVPVVSATKDLSELNTASTLQGFSDIRGPLNPGYLEVPEMGLAYLPAQGEQTSGKIHFCYSPHLTDGEIPSFAWTELDLSSPAPAGPWYLGNIGDNWTTDYYTKDYMFDIPSSWAASYTPGMLLATGRYREGGQASQGPALYAYGPWNSGNPPAVNTRLQATTLLQYSSVTDSPQYTIDDYCHSDAWEAGAWLTAGSDAAVIIAGTKGLVSCWYGFADGTIWPEEPPYPDIPPYPNDERGFWATGFESRILFFDPDDLARVVQGEMQPYEPQPYATLNVDSYLYNVTSSQQRDHIGDMAFDRSRGILYLMEPLVDDEQSIVHVFRFSSGS